MLTIRAGASPLPALPANAYSRWSGGLEWTGFDDDDETPICYRDFHGTIRARP